MSVRKWSPNGEIPDWSEPELSRSGQDLFWDRQSKTYSSAEMTDNEGELQLVARLCEEFVQQGFVASDIVTFGGANACRDPKVVFKVLNDVGCSPQEVFFNDLSAEMVRAAIEGELSLISSLGIPVTAVAGAAHEVAARVFIRPRRVLIGVYSVQALHTSDPKSGRLVSGLERYVRNARILGDRFVIDLLEITEGKYGKHRCRLFLDASCTEDELHATERKLRELVLLSPPAVAFRVVGEHEGQPGFFLSHWFTLEGIASLVGRHFPVRHFPHSFIEACAEGYVVRMDPVDSPEGIVTMLNNVLGNILPDEQGATLTAIASCSK